MSVPTTNREPFRLGLPFRPSSPLQSSHGPVHPPDVFASQRERTTTTHENCDAESSSHPSPVPCDPASEEDIFDDTDPLRDSTHWKKHVFRLVKRNEHEYYDVRGDAVSTSGKA